MAKFDTSFNFGANKRSSGSKSKKGGKRTLNAKQKQNAAIYAKGG